MALAYIARRWCEDDALCRRNIDDLFGSADCLDTVRNQARRPYPNPLPATIFAVGVGIAAKNLADAALEDAQSFEKFNRVLSGVPGVTDKVIASTDDWIATMQLATLVSDTDLRSALGKLALATGDVTKAQDLLTVAVDTSPSASVSV